MSRKWTSILTDIYKELVTVNMAITFLAGRVTHCSEPWTPDVAVDLEDTAHSLQTKPGRLLMRAPRSRRFQKMLKDVRENKI